MAAQNTDDNDECPFCLIVQSQNASEILMIPGAGHHYLVITKTHINNCKMLRSEHIPTVERMAEMGRNILEKNKVRDMTDIRLGFHVPPFSSVPHLHLHALAPASKMNESSQRRYGPGSAWFITVEEALSQLRARGRIK
ncbi:adenosine 5'-monophosphoramidase HINT3-like isoform X2 [Stigmatopora nigra]